MTAATAPSARTFDSVTLQVTIRSLPNGEPLTEQDVIDSVEAALEEAGFFRPVVEIRS